MRAKSSNNRLVIIAVTLTVIATLYSLSELHHISAEHTELEKRNTFDTHRSVTAVNEIKPKQALPVSVATANAISVAAGDRKSFAYPNTELWGDVVTWGTSNKATSSDDCAKQCINYVPPTEDDFQCNVWVYCGEPSCDAAKDQCWLKHLAHPEAAKPAKEGKDIPWTSGTLDVDMNAKSGMESGPEKKVLRTYHVVTSAQGPAVHWQIRIHYYWYKKQKHQCEAEGNCEMGGFTRLLHSGKADELMDEIPTMVVDPLPADMVEHSWYVVLNRPYAFVQWVKAANIPEKYILMSEPDHIMLRPLPNFMTSEAPAAFPFFYIEPGKKEHQKITMKYTGQITKKQLDEIAPIGNSPTFMSMADMKTVMPLWMNTSIAIFKDPEASKAWGWVQEMYGFTIGLWLGGVKKVDLYLPMMAQPPWDRNLDMAPGKPFYIIHYTYGMDYKLTGEFTPGKIGEWRFDKRAYGGRPLPRHMAEPPEKMDNMLVRTLINAFNEATAAIPCWDEYEKTGIANKECGEKPGGFLALEEELKAKGKTS